MFVFCERSVRRRTDMTVAVLYDLVCRDGRNAVEVRVAQPLGNGYFAGSKNTVYSCAYDNELGRQVALKRARELCDQSSYTIVHVADAENNRRAAWQ